MSSVLIVDDDVAALATFQQALRLEGFDVMVASTASHAARVARAAPVGLIVADLRLPDRTGIDLLRDLRAAGFGTPFVMMTGFGSVESALDAIKYGADDYLEKPLWIEQLLNIATTFIGTPHGVLSDGSHAPNQRIIQAMKIIESRFRDSHLTATVVAQGVNTSLEHLSRLFGKHTGRGLLATIREFRLAEATRLLKGSNLSVKEVSHSAGFASVNQFERDFKRRFRCSPKEFRLSRVRDVSAG